ncbi:MULTISPECIES: MmpS family transport accessory protein [Mycobacterium]|uniref:MmpS family transport accessory protein n=1 Tax=Mycobacterium sp. FLAC0960 TaxID=3053611 RepID=UPI001F0C1978|nr:MULTISPECIES: MmpS family transport accessory protein [Mycobacterium]MDM4141855.1 MmpS family transport accessory protein [Mycobacterium sp. FLAC0960]
MVTSSDSGTRPGLLTRVLKRAWIPLVLVVVLATSALIVSRLHKIFGSEDLNANAGKGIEIVQFNPKVVVYEISGAPGTTANINYWDENANTHQVNNAPLPWSTTISTTLPSVSANIMAQSDGSTISCKITVDGVLRDNQNSAGHNAQTFCLVKSA